MKISTTNPSIEPQLLAFTKGLCAKHNLSQEKAEALLTKARENIDATTWKQKERKIIAALKQEIEKLID